MTGYRKDINIIMLGLRPPLNTLRYLITSLFFLNITLERIPTRNKTDN